MLNQHSFETCRNQLFKSVGWTCCFFVLLFFSLIFSVFATSSSQSVRVGVYDNQPKVYQDDKGVDLGVYPDILNYIAARENWKLNYIHGTWEEGLRRLKKGEIDLMVDVAVSDERLKEFDFTKETVMGSWGAVCADKKTKIESLQDLNGKKIAIVKSSVYLGGEDGIDIYIKALGLKVQFIYVDEYDQTYELLNKGEVDAAVVSHIFAIASQKNYPRIVRTNIFLKPTELRFALTKGKTDNLYLIERLDYWVKRLKDDEGSVYYKSLENHGLTAAITVQEVHPKWLLPAQLAAAIIIFLLLLFIIWLTQKRSILINKFRSLFESMTEMVVLHEMIYDENGKAIDYRVIDCNPAFSDMTGIPREKAIGAKASELYGTGDAPYLSIYDDVVKTGHPKRFETFFKNLNKYFDISVFSPSPGRFGTTMSDITDRKNTEKLIESRRKELEKLAQSEEEAKKAMLNVMEDFEEAKLCLEVGKTRDEAILASIGDGIIATDPDRRIIVMNKAAERLLGWKVNEAIGKLYDDVVLLEDEKGTYVPFKEKPLHKAFDSRVTTTIATLYLLSKNKIKFPVAITVSPVILKNKIIGAVEVFRDIAHEKEIENAKTEFASLASHQLRTPFATINWYIELLLGKDVGELNAKQTKYLKEMYHASCRMVTLVNAILSVSRVEMGKSEIMEKPTNVVRLIETITEEEKPEIKEKNLEVEKKIDKNIPQVMTDPEKLTIVIENLINNSIKYSPVKGKICVNLNLKGNTLMFSVADSGIGIPETAKPQIFTRFFRADNAKAQDPEGAGLGLYIVKAIVDLMGGKIWFESKENHGTTFFVSLPIKLTSKKL